MSLVRAGRLRISLVVRFLATTSLSLAQTVARTSDPAKRGLKNTDFPRTIKITDNVYTYEDFHAGPLQWVRNKINDLVLHARNAEALRRLAELAENSRRPGSVPR